MSWVGVAGPSGCFSMCLTFHRVQPIATTFAHVSRRITGFARLDRRVTGAGWSSRHRRPGPAAADRRAGPAAGFGSLGGPDRTARCPVPARRRPPDIRRWSDDRSGRPAASRPVAPGLSRERHPHFAVPRRYASATPVRPTAMRSGWTADFTGPGHGRQQLDRCRGETTVAGTEVAVDVEFVTGKRIGGEIEVRRLRAVRPDQDRRSVRSTSGPIPARMSVDRLPNAGSTAMPPDIARYARTPRSARPMSTMSPGRTGTGTPQPASRDPT